ncbi:MAG TPA: cysteine--tRNA ligase [Xanthobacteraceae bacterium]|nr:cysteine--tRNA ligase [Xanthobacteraceae bacterium]
MELTLYDTFTREKRPFTPLDSAGVRMYVCGPTVYDFAHIGNARPVIVFDVLFRLLQYLAKQGVWDGGKGETTVTYVRNITDVDDKINARAAEEYPDLPLNEAIRRVTETTDKQFHEDVSALGCLPPTEEPRATEHIAKMKELIERLVASEHAYVAEQHVLFRVSSMADYGKLSKRSLDEMIAGARVEVAPYKRDPMDFVLWKPSKAGEPAWPSPRGIAAPGRPGWHIECSAMAWKYLGETFDIHGGGIDLVFPHHENEIAQTRCVFHTPLMANFWMHNGFLQVEGRKMAKSEGNFITIRELRADWPGEVLRLNMLRTHYRQPIDWTIASLEEALTTWTDWKKIISQVDVQKIEIQPDEQFVGALLDDLNTSAAISYLHEVAKVAHNSLEASAVLYRDLVFSGLIPDQLAVAEEGKLKVKKEVQLPDDADADTIARYKPQIETVLSKWFADLPSSVNSTSTLSTATRLLSLDPGQIRVWKLWTKHNPYYLSSSDRAHVEQVIGIEPLNERIEARLAARNAKDFVQSDTIRDELKAKDIELEDHKDGTTTWKVKR